MRDIKFANEVILAARNHMNAINKVLIPSRFQEKSERTEQREKKRKEFQHLKYQKIILNMQRKYS